LMPSSIRRHHWSSASILRASVLDIAQQSKPYRNIGKIHVLKYSFNFVDMASRVLVVVGQWCGQFRRGHLSWLVSDVVGFDVVTGRGWSVMWSVSTWSLLVGDNVSPGDAPAIIMQYVAWMERQFSTCQTLAACTHLPATVSQLFEPQVQKIVVFTYRSPHFCFPGDAPAIITQYVASRDLLHSHKS